MDIIFFGNMTQFDRNVSTFPKKKKTCSHHLHDLLFKIHTLTSEKSAVMYLPILIEKGLNMYEHKSVDLSKKPNDPVWSEIQIKKHVLCFRALR